MNRQGVLNQSGYSRLWARLNKVVQKTHDRYKGKPYFPIGTKRPIYTYDLSKDIPEEEIKFFRLDTTAPDNATSVMAVGQSGTQKTTLIKTLTYYNSLLPKTKIGILDLKGSSRDWEMVNYPHSNKGTLYNESNTMSIYAGCPSFSIKGMPENMKEKINKMNLKPQDFADMNVLTGLGFSPIAKQHLFKMLKKGLSPQIILKLVEKLYSKKKLVKSTYENLSLILDNMYRQEFLADDNFFDIDKIWSNGSHWALGFNNKETEYLSVYVDKILTKVFDRANTTGRKERYWIIVDDCQKAFGLDASKYPSVQTGIDSLTQWRFCGINMLLAIQSPGLLDKEMYSDIKHFFIYRTGQLGTLANYIPNKEIIEQSRTLMFQPENFVSECIHVFPDRHRYERFFPCNSPIAN